jgi:hypothetical protein
MPSLISLCLCVASTVPIGVARHFNEAARRQGMTVSRMTAYETSVSISHRVIPDRCSVAVFPGYADTASAYFMNYDRRTAMTSSRVAALLADWEEWL